MVYTHPFMMETVMRRRESLVFSPVMTDCGKVTILHLTGSLKWRRDSHQNLFPHAANHPSSNDKEGLGEFKEEILVEGVTKILVLLPSSYP